MLRMRGGDGARPGVNKDGRVLVQTRLPFGAERLEGEVAVAPIRCEGRRGSKKEKSLKILIAAVPSDMVSLATGNL